VRQSVRVQRQTHEKNNSERPKICSAKRGERPKLKPGVELRIKVSTGLRENQARCQENTSLEGEVFGGQVQREDLGKGALVNKTVQVLFQEEFFPEKREFEGNNQRKGGASQLGGRGQKGRRTEQKNQKRCRSNVRPPNENPKITASNKRRRRNLKPMSRTPCQKTTALKITGRSCQKTAMHWRDCPA